MVSVRSRAILVAELLLAAAVCALWNSSFPVLLPLFVLATVALWVRGRSWNSAGLTAGPGSALEAVVGLLCGGAAAVAVFAALGPGAMPSLSALPPGITAAVMTAITVVALAFAAELAFRGYVITRITEQFGASWRWHAVVVGGLLPALAAWRLGPVAMLGAMAAGVGFGALFVGARGRIVACGCAHVGFDGGLSVLGLWFL